MNVFADDRGIWRTGASGDPQGIEWGEIARVSGYRLKGVTDAYTCVMLDFVYGDSFEFDETTPGFSETVEAMTRRLPHIPKDWLQSVRCLSATLTPLQVWSASEILR